MPRVQTHLHDLGTANNQPEPAGSPARGQAREVDVVERSLQAVITAKQRIGQTEDIKTLQDAIDLWNKQKQ